MNYNKYHSSKCRCSQGHIHDSRKEARRCNELTLMEKAGSISNLRQQVKYVLIPAQREFAGGWYSKGVNKGQPKPGKIIERECCYIADFAYTENGAEVVEDTKGIRTKDYIIKRKLMLYVNGIRIREV